MAPKTLIAILLLASTVNAVNAAEASCTPAHKFDTISPGALTVATSTLPPFDSLDTSGKYSGIEADVLAKFAAKECINLKPVLVDPSGQIQYVVAGRSDLSAFGWYRSEARTKVLNLSTPLLLERLAIYSKDGTNSLDSLRGRRVGTVQGYLWVPDLQALLGDSLKLYPTPVALAQDLTAGRIDAGIDSFTKGAYAQQHSGGYPGLAIKPALPDAKVKASVLPAQTAFLISKDNGPLLNALNATVEEMRSSGELGKLLKKYGLDPSAAQVGEPRLVK
jgi:polar amino acid transport system substrate-binding protein